MRRPFRASLVDSTGLAEVLDEGVEPFSLKGLFSWAKPASRRVRTRTVLQMEAAECGAAALAIVFARHGLFVPLEKLREDCGVSRDGTSAARILAAARRYGFKTSGYLKEPEELGDIEFPAIVHWNFDHFVVLEGLSGSRAWINDPARGRRTVTRPVFDRSFTGPVLVITPDQRFVPGGRPLNPLQIVLEWLKGYRSTVLALVFIGFLLLFPGIAVPMLSGAFVDRVLSQQTSDLLYPLVVGMAFTALVRGVLTYLQRNVLSELWRKLAFDLSCQYLWRALHLPLTFFLARHPGDLTARAEIGDRLGSLLAGDLPTVALSALMAFWFAVLMAWLDWRLAIVAFLFAGLGILMERWAARLRSEKADLVTHEEARWLGTTVSGLQTIETLKANGIEARFFEKWSAQHLRLVSLQQTLGTLSESLASTTRSLHALGVLVVLGLGSAKIMDGAMTIGTLVAFQSLMASFFGPLGELAGFAARWDEMCAQISRFNDVLTHPPAVRRCVKSETNSLPIGRVSFENVTFGYNRALRPSIRNISFTVDPGNRLAIVGRTGSGKSTIARLLTGLIHPWSGDIICNPVSLASVQQEIQLFEGTIAENVTLWDPSIPQEAVFRAIHDSCLDSLIARLPQGLETRLIENGRNFSGGERQRIEIARALVRSPAVLVLDEATSALDPETEEILLERLRRRGCTCVIIAHRLSAVRDCQEILVLDSGRVVQRGAHRDLSNEVGPYQGLVVTEV